MEGMWLSLRANRYDCQDRRPEASSRTTLAKQVLLAWQLVDSSSTGAVRGVQQLERASQEVGLFKLQHMRKTALSAARIAGTRIRISIPPELLGHLDLADRSLQLLDTTPASD